MKLYIETRSDKSTSSNSPSDLAGIILKNNYFENEELKYHQKRGTVIGTKFPPQYSNLFMVGLEKIIFQNSEFEPFLWLWSLDEIFCIWFQGSRKLNGLFNCRNSLHWTIKFTTDNSITIDKLETDLYCKTNNAPVSSCTLMSP